MYPASTLIEGFAALEYLWLLLIEPYFEASLIIWCEQTAPVVEQNIE